MSQYSIIEFDDSVETDCKHNWFKDYPFEFDYYKPQNKIKELTVSSHSELKDLVCQWIGEVEGKLKKFSRFNDDYDFFLLARYKTFRAISEGIKNDCYADTLKGLFFAFRTAMPTVNTYEMDSSAINNSQIISYQELVDNMFDSLYTTDEKELDDTEVSNENKNLIKKYFADREINLKIIEALVEFNNEIDDQEDFNRYEKFETSTWVLKKFFMLKKNKENNIDKNPTFIRYFQIETPSLTCCYIKSLIYDSDQV